MPRYSDDSVHTSTKGEIAKIRHLQTRRRDERDAVADLIRHPIETSFPLAAAFSSKRAEQPHRRQVSGAFGKPLNPYEPS